MLVSTATTTWITLRDMGRILGIGRSSAAKLARTGKVRSQLLPGLKRRRYALDDVLRLAAEPETGGIPEASGEGGPGQ